MRRLSCALVFMSALGASVCNAADNQASVDEKQQLIQAQQTEDQLRQPTVELIKKYQPIHNKYGSISGLRLAKDRLQELDDSRVARASAYWTLMNLSLPLREPLSDAQHSDLEAFVAAFGACPQSLTGKQVLADHDKLVEGIAARKILDGLSLRTSSDPLSPDQVKGLEEIETKYPHSPAGLIASDFLRAHYNRESQAEAKAAGLVNNYAEQFASRRLGYARSRLGIRNDKNLFRQALADIVEDYPDTLAAKDAAAQLVNVEREIQANIANSRFINEYWDAVYPMRTTKPVSDGFYHN